MVDKTFMVVVKLYPVLGLVVTALYVPGFRLLMDKVATPFVSVFLVKDLPFNVILTLVFFNAFPFVSRNFAEYFAVPL